MIAKVFLKTRSADLYNAAKAEYCLPTGADPGIGAFLDGIAAVTVKISPDDATFTRVQEAAALHHVLVGNDLDAHAKIVRRAWCVGKLYDYVDNLVAIVPRFSVELARELRVAMYTEAKVPKAPLIPPPSVYIAPAFPSAIRNAPTSALITRVLLKALDGYFVSPEEVGDFTIGFLGHFLGQSPMQSLGSAYTKQRAQALVPMLFDWAEKYNQWSTLFDALHQIAPKEELFTEAANAFPLTADAPAPPIPRGLVAALCTLFVDRQSAYRNIFEEVTGGSIQNITPRYFSWTIGRSLVVARANGVDYALLRALCEFDANFPAGSEKLVAQGVLAHATVKLRVAREAEQAAEKKRAVEAPVSPEAVPETSPSPVENATIAACKAALVPILTALGATVLGKLLGGFLPGGSLGSGTIEQAIPKALEAAQEQGLLAELADKAWQESLNNLRETSKV